MLGQAIVAAGRHSPGRRAVSAHMIFQRPADAAQPLHFDLRELSSGRSFTTLAVDVAQSDRRCASATLLLDVTAADLIRHSVDPPDVPGPYLCPSYDMSVTGRDVRVVHGTYTDDPAEPVGPPVIDAWVRFRDLPDDPCLHAGLLAQFTGHMSIAAALRPHPGVGQRQAHRTDLHRDQRHRAVTARRCASRWLDALPPRVDVCRRRHDSLGVPRARRAGATPGLLLRGRHGAGFRGHDRSIG